MQVVDVGTGRQRDAVFLDHVLVERKTSHRIRPLPQRNQVVGRTDGQGNVVIVDHVAVEIALHETVPDQVRGIDGSQDRQERVVLDLRLHLAQEHLERQVALDVQFAGVDPVALVFLDQAVPVDRDFAVQRDDQDIDRQESPGEEVDTGVAPHDHHHQVDLVDQCQEEHRERQVHQHAVKVEIGQAVWLQRNPGIQQQRPQHEMDVARQAQAGQDQQGDAESPAPRRERLHTLMDAITHHEQGVESQRHDHIVEQQAAQRIEDRRVGIEHRRE